MKILSSNKIIPLKRTRKQNERREKKIEQTRNKYHFTFSLVEVEKKLSTLSSVLEKKLADLSRKLSSLSLSPV